MIGVMRIILLFLSCYAKMREMGVFYDLFLL